MSLSGFRRLQDDWPLLTYYQKFEGVVALILTLIIGLIVVVALFRLTFTVVSGLILGALDPLDHDVFQTVFGEIMTLLIALEFNHTLQYVVTRQQSFIQTSVVLLIALLALARKFIILDLHTVTEGQVFGLAAATLALGATYWLLKERQSQQGGE
ncbi:MAG: phosphate-starvation-inducible PsiE family protein [Nitrospirota bacterium]